MILVPQLSTELLKEGAGQVQYLSLSEEQLQRLTAGSAAALLKAPTSDSKLQVSTNKTGLRRLQRLVTTVEKGTHAGTIQLNVLLFSAFALVFSEQPEYCKRVRILLWYVCLQCVGGGRYLEVY